MSEKRNTEDVDVQDQLNNIFCTFKNQPRSPQIDTCPAQHPTPGL